MRRWKERRLRHRASSSTNTAATTGLRVGAVKQPIMITTDHLMAALVLPLIPPPCGDAFSRLT